MNLLSLRFVRTGFLILICCLVMATRTEGQWVWARNAITAGSNLYGGISAVSANGAIYMTGQLNGLSVTYGTHTITDSTLQFNVFLVKYDSAGNVVWAKGTECAFGSKPISITTDLVGNVIIAGYFKGPYIRFDSFLLYNSDASGSSANMFVAKFNSAGNLLWSSAAADEAGYDETATSVCTDTWGNVFVSGNYNSPFMAFGTDTINNPWYNYGSNAVFVAKYDSLGHFLWVQNYFGKRNGGGSVGGSATDAAGSFYLTGTFNDSSFTFGTTVLTNPNIYLNAVFLTKIDSAGNVKWVKGANSVDGVTGNSVATDHFGHVYLGGTFNSSFYVDFGLGHLTTGSMYLVKYDTSGTPIWNKGAGTRGATSVATDGSGNIFVSGTFSPGSVTLGTYTITDTSTNFYADMFIVKYDSTGNVLWADGVGGYYDMNPASVNTYGHDVYVSGWSGCPYLNFGTVSLVNTSDHYDTYLAKLRIETTLGTGQVSNTARKPTISPNPNTGEMTVRLCRESYNTITICDLLGKMIYSTTISNGERSLQIDLREYANGVYFLSAASEKGLDTVPFVICR